MIAAAIASDAVTADAIAANAVDTVEIILECVINDDAVTTDKIANVQVAFFFGWNIFNEDFRNNYNAFYN